MADSPAPKRSLVRRLWGLLMFLAVVAALASSAYLFVRLKREQAARTALAAEVAAFGPRFEQFKGAVRDVNRQLTSNVFHQVDLATAGWQPIAGGFYVIDISANAAGKGTRIVGKIVNPTSVVHESAQFSIRVDDKRATFTLPKVPPGIAQPFEVTLPDIAPGATQKAFIALESSTINFASSTTSRRSGGDPVDTDRLLK
jgi:hypothetical protein